VNDFDFGLAWKAIDDASSFLRPAVDQAAAKLGK
jgi:hypothetical protein